MTEIETIIRIAAKGDGVTASGRHFPRVAPGDIVQPDGTIEAGPHHIAPICRHAGTCGGCQLQHCDDESLTDYVAGRVFGAALGQELDPGPVTPAHLSPPRSRRRAMLKAVNGGGGQPLIGFREAGSHKIVGLKECHVLAPQLFALIAPLRRAMSGKKGRYSIEIELVLLDQGVDCTIKGWELDGLQETEALLDFCRDQKLARMTLDQGYGAEGFWEPEPVTVSFDRVAVDYPVGAFLQATRDGEAALIDFTKEWLAGSTAIVDLFSGLGTFAFPLAKQKGVTKVLAVEGMMAAFMACRKAAGRSRLPVEAMHRDLFRSPLRVEELAGYDAVVIDPPRAGAKEQVIQLIKSDVEKIVYISCNPSSWARDAARLVEAGYELVELRSIGQFRWSIHVELASLFIKRG